MNTVASISGLTILGPRTSILEDIDLTLESGTVTGLVGASGAGKTTLALALLGHLPSGLRRGSGEVRVAGSDPFTRRGKRAIRGRNAAYLPQDAASALDPARTVAAQLRTACRIAHPTVSRVERTEITRDAVAGAALEHELLGRRPLQLSGGQAQRALLAWTLVTRPELLILDEPTSSLDPETAVRVSRTFANLPWKPAVLLVSHDRELIARVSHRVREIDGGRLDTPDHGDRTSPLTSRPESSPAPPGMPDGRPPVLAAERLTIRRGGNAVVRDVALTLSLGEMVAIRGRTGSGKTSMARALCGFVSPDTGSLFIDGLPIPWDADERARRQGPFVAYVGQDARAALHPSETVQRTLGRALATARNRRTSRFTAADELLDLVGLQRTALDCRPHELSGGQRHRVALARALAANPVALICDETTAALDDAIAARILDTLDGIRAETGLPVLLITHQDSVAARADRILVLSEGSLE